MKTPVYPIFSYQSHFIRSWLIFIVLIAFFTNSLGISFSFAQDYHLPAPGVMVHLSSPLDPPILKGIKVYPDNPFRFDFILDKGDRPISNEQLQEESTNLIKYFLASLTVPEKDLWVNLSPYEKNRIIPNRFGLTEMGRDLLAEDYMLKQITASLIYPEDEVGKRFWKKVYEQAAKRYGTTDIPVNTFNKVWIVPQKAVVYENAKVGTAYVLESRLKVMLEQDYLSLEKHEGLKTTIQPKKTSQLGSDIVREIVIPQLDREVNENKNFAKLRQVYNSLILATWYKKKIKDSILSEVYVDRNKITGVKNDDPNENDRIYDKYLRAFKKGVFNYIKEDVDPSTQESIPRKYFSGGVNYAMIGEEAAKVYRATENFPDAAMPSNEKENEVIVNSEVKLPSLPGTVNESATNPAVGIDKLDSASAPRIVNDNEGLWFNQGWLAGYLNDQILTVNEQSRPDFNIWLNNPESLKDQMTASSGTFKYYQILHHLNKQSEHSEQALVELVSNGLDAMDAWIKRFGLGFHQALGELQSLDDRVYFAGETKDGQKLGLVFKRIENGSLLVRPMNQQELLNYFKGQTSQRTLVRVQKKMTQKYQQEYIYYLKARINGSQRTKVLLKSGDQEPVLLNPLEGFRSLVTASENLSYLNEDQFVQINMDDNGYSVSNPGVIQASMFFEKLIPPRLGGTPGITRTQEGQKVPADIFYKLPQSTLASNRCRVTIQVAEMGVDSFELTGLGLPEEMIIKLPPNSSLNVSRGEVHLDDVYKAAMEQIISRIEQMDDIGAIAALANGLMGYWNRISLSSQSSRRITDRLKEVTVSRLRKMIADRISGERDLLVLPAVGNFERMSIDATHQRLIYLDESLFDFNLRPIPGLNPVEDFQSDNDTKNRLYFVAYKQGETHPPIFQAGGMIILDQEIYEWAKNDPLRMAMVNWWMNFQVGYGTPRKGLGWWGASPQKNNTPTATVYVKDPDLQLLMTELPNNFDELQRRVWESWFWEQLQKSENRSRAVGELRSYIQMWQQWISQFFSQGDEVPSVANVLETQQLPYIQDDDVKTFPDGRNVLVYRNNGKNNLLIETQPHSGQWINRTIQHPTEFESMIDDAGTKPKIIGMAGGRLIIQYTGRVGAIETHRGIIFIEIKPGSGRFKLVETEITPGQPKPINFEDFVYSFGSILNTDDEGRLYLINRYDELFRERTPNSGVLEPVKEVPPLHPSYVNILGDGRIQFLYDNVLNREISQGNGNFEQVNLPTQSNHFKFLEDGRVLAENVRYLYPTPNIEEKLEEKFIWLETSVGSGRFEKVEIEGPQKNSREIRRVQTVNGRLCIVTSPGAYGYDKKIFIFSPDVKKFLQLRLKQSSNDIIQFNFSENNSMELITDKSGRLVVKVLVFTHSGGKGTRIERLYRETTPGSGVIEEIKLPRKRDGSNGQMYSVVDDSFELSDGRLVLRHEIFTSINEHKDFDYYVETFPGSSEFEDPSLGLRSAMIIDGHWVDNDRIYGATYYQGSWERKQPEPLSRTEIQTIHDLLAGPEVFSENRGILLRNIAKLGKQVMPYLELALFLPPELLGILNEESRDHLMQMIHERSKNEKQELLSFIQDLFDQNIRDPKRLNQFVQRWVNLVKADQEFAQEFAKNPNSSIYLADSELDIADVPQQLQGIVNYFRDPEALVLPKHRPTAVSDEFHPAEAANTNLQIPNLTLAELLTIIHKFGSAFEVDEGEILHLGKVKEVIQTARNLGKMDPTAQAERIRRTVQAQADGYAVWVRELVQNARDEIRRRGLQSSGQVHISAWMEGNNRIVRVQDPIGMSLRKILNTYFPIDRSDKGGNLTGKLGQGNYSVWLDADSIRIRTGEGDGLSYIIELKAKRDEHGQIQQIFVERFEEFNDGYKGTTIEHEKNYQENDDKRFVEAALLQHALVNFIGDTRDVGVTYQGQKIKEEVRLMSTVEDSKLNGQFEVLITKGTSRVTSDGLQVHALTNTDWDAVHPIIRTQLESQGNILMRWPKGAPLTEPRNEVSLNEMDSARWLNLRSVAIHLASAEELHQHGAWVADLPQDILDSSSSIVQDIVDDADKINSGRWDEVDMSKYKKEGENAILLIILLKGATNRMSITDLQRKIQKLANDHFTASVDHEEKRMDDLQWAQSQESTQKSIKDLINKFPGLEYRISKAFDRNIQILTDNRRVENIPEQERSIENQTLGEAGYKLTDRLFKSFVTTVNDQNIRPRQSRMSLKEDATAFVSSLSPTTIHFSKRFAASMEKLLETIGNRELTKEDIVFFLSQADIFPHEYRHTEEFLDTGRSSHLTHSKEGVLENSFPQGMRRIIERLIKNRWDIRKALSVQAAEETTAQGATEGKSAAMISRVRFLSDYQYDFLDLRHKEIPFYTGQFKFVNVGDTQEAVVIDDRYHFIVINDDKFRYLPHEKRVNLLIMALLKADQLRGTGYFRDLKKYSKMKAFRWGTVLTEFYYRAFHQSDPVRVSYETIMAGRISYTPYNNGIEVVHVNGIDPQEDRYDQLLAFRDFMGRGNSFGGLAGLNKINADTIFLTFENEIKRELENWGRSAQATVGQPDVWETMAIGKRDDQIWGINRPFWVGIIGDEFSRMFRYPSFDEAFKGRIFPGIIRQKQHNVTVHIGIIGPGLGEEPATIAILVRKVLGSRTDLKVKISVSGKGMAFEKLKNNNVYYSEIPDGEDWAFKYDSIKRAYKRSPEFNEMLKFKDLDLLNNPVQTGTPYDMLIIHNVLQYLRPVDNESSDVFSTKVDRAFKFMKDSVQPGGIISIAGIEADWANEVRNSLSRSGIIEIENGGHLLRELNFKLFTIPGDHRASRAMTALLERTKRGGIDLGNVNKVLQTKNAGESIRFHLNAAQLARLQNAPGFVPIILDIQPMINLRKFLGVSTQVSSPV